MVLDIKGYVGTSVTTHNRICVLAAAMGCSGRRNFMATTHEQKIDNVRSLAKPASFPVEAIFG